MCYASWKKLFSVMGLMLLAFFPLKRAYGGEETQHPAIWFIGEKFHDCNYELARRLQKAGYTLNKMSYPGMNQKDALTWEQVKKYNILVMSGIGSTNADLSLNETNRKNIAVIRKFLAAGGGVFFIPQWCQKIIRIPAQKEFLRPLGLTPLFAETVTDAAGTIRATAWQLPFAYTDAILPSPITKGVSSLWLPIDTRMGMQDHTVPFRADKNWTIVVRGAKTSATRHDPISGLVEKGDLFRSLTSSVPVVAYRTVGAGRLVVCGITPEYIYEKYALTTLEGLFMTTGLNGKPSQGRTLFMNSLRWLAEPSLANGQLGGAGMDKSMLKNPSLNIPCKAFDWQKKRPPLLPGLAATGVIGARSTYSSGKGSVEEWAASATAAGLSYLVFLENLTDLTPDEFAKLKADCQRLSTKSLALIPGYTLDDEVGNHYFYFGSKCLYPNKKLLSKDGTVFVSYDKEFRPKNPTSIKGQLSMTTLVHGYEMGGFKLTSGHYYYQKDAAPFDDFFSNWDATAVVVSENGKLTEDAFAGYLTLVDSGQGPLPLALNFMTTPSQLAQSKWKTVLRIPGAKTAADGRVLAAKEIASYWETWHFYPDNPTAIFITSGPIIDNWSFVGPRDYEGSNPNDFVWQNLRWRVQGKVSAEEGIDRVEIFDGPTLFRRFICNGDKTFSFQLALTHDKQHNLVLVVTDKKGQRAISGGQWDRNHRQEEFMCGDRNNQLAYGRSVNSRGIAVKVAGTPATPNKRTGHMEIQAPGGFHSDLRLGATAFDGAAVGAPPFMPRPGFLIKGTKLSKPTVCESFRLLDTGDVNIGEGRYENIFTDNIRVANVWHTLWRTKPAPDYTLNTRRIFFHPDPDSPLAVYLCQTRVKLRRDIPNQGLRAGSIRTDKARLWCVRGSDDSYRAGVWENPGLSQWRNIRIPFGLGAYASMLNSPLGGVTIFPLSKGLTAQLTLPDRSNQNARFFLPAQQSTLQKSGDQAVIRFLIVGTPRGTKDSKNLPAASNELIERFYHDFGLTATGKPTYTVKSRAGTITSQRYIMAVDGKAQRAFSGTLSGDLISSLPIVVSGLNDNWSAYLYDLVSKKARPLGVFENKAWAVTPLHGTQDLFVGQPVIANQKAVFIQVTQTGAKEWTVEVNNPLAKELSVELKANPLFPPFQGKDLAATIKLPGGSSKVLHW